MPLAILYSRARAGINAPLVTVEVHLANGLPALSIVGLPEMAVRESKDRVRSALLNSHFEFPARRITINLAPADLPKEGDGSIWPSPSAYWPPPARSPSNHWPVMNSSVNWHSPANSGQSKGYCLSHWRHGMRDAH